MTHRLINWFGARDPAYLRLYAAARVTAAALTTVLAAGVLLGPLTGQRVLSAQLLAMLVTFFTLQMVNDARPRERRLSMLLALVPVAAGITLVALGSDLPILHVIALAGLLFVSFWARRYGVRTGELMLIGVMVYYFALRFRVTPAVLWIYLVAATAGLASALLFMFVIMPYRPQHSLRQAIAAFYERAAEIVSRLGKNLEQDADVQDETSLRASLRQLRATRRVIESLTIAAVSPEEWTGELLARLQLDLYNAEQALDVMVEGAVRLGPVRKALPDEVRIRLAAGLGALRDSLRERVSPASAAAAAATELERFREQFGASAASAARGASAESTWIAPALAMAAAGARLGQAAKSTRENDPKSWGLQAGSATTPVQRGAPPAAATVEFAGLRLHVTTALGIQAALASAVALLLAMALGLPTPLTAFLSAFLVVSSSAGESVRRAWLRVLGSIGGVIAGLAVGQLLPDSLPVVLAVSAAAVFMAVYATAVSYNWMVFWITIAAMQPLTLAPGLNLDAGISRILNITLGAVIAALVANFVLPLRTRARFNAAQAAFLGAADQLIAHFVGTLLRGQAELLDDLESREYAVSAAYARLSGLFPSAAYEYSPLSQRQSGLSERTTQLAALHDYVTHMADEVKIDGPAPADDMRRGILTTLQDEIHENLQAIARALKEEGAPSSLLKRANIEVLVDARQLAGGETPPQPGYLTIAVRELLRIRSVILELGARQGIQAA